ncbi:hypothetical protein F3Y22_tig00110474pilonHSYRG00127 [Hibiscus syriacus]|uniref:Integrase catalytic domain-containing protein n=1 Tax=Hibiscus syriacus TaxID=106335 RepID=A0A6A3AIK0_HIBSY|nr:hypothetical protein F3Y22_tig00110474pilonHSYRG00127 [Hibiscus syriacus]
MRSKTGQFSLPNVRSENIVNVTLRTRIRVGYGLGVLQNFYEHCVLGKQKRVKFGTTIHNTKCIVDYIHSDVWGPSKTSYLGGNHYFVTFVDVFSRRVWVYPMKSKDEVLRIFLKWKNMIENQTGRKIKRLRTDNGGEYKSDPFFDVCHEYGIVRHFTVRNTPQQNGVAERMNQTLLEKVRCMLSNAGLGKAFWAEAVTYASHLINRLPSSAIGGKTPLEVWSGKPATDYDSLHIFGSIAYYHVKESKLDLREKKALFMGITHGVKGFRLWCLDTKKIICSRDVTFDEYALVKKVTNEAVQTSSTPQQVEHTPKQVEFQQTMIPEVDAADSSTPIEESEDEEVVDDDIPITYQEAIQSLESDKWKSVIDEEMQSLQKNNTWKLTQLPKVKGYAQNEGIDYNEVFSHVVKHSSIRILLALVAKLNLELAQLDVKTAFLHGDLEDEIYMTQPEGYKDGGREKWSQKEIDKLKAQLNQEFEMKDLGEAKKIGMEIRRDRQREKLCLTQKQYLRKCVVGYDDSDYAGDLDKRRSTTRYLFTLAKAPSAIHLAKNQVYYSRTKHIDVRYHFVREIFEEGKILLQKIATSKNPADMMTKFDMFTLMLTHYLRNFLFSDPDPGPDYPEVLRNKKMGTNLVSSAMISPPSPQRYSGSREDFLSQAFYLFNRLSYLFADLILGYNEREICHSMISSKSSEEAFELVEGELGLLYDALYTKLAYLNYKTISYRRVFTLFTSILSLVLFMKFVDYNSSLADISITYLLLIGAVVLEAYGFVVLMRSDWTKLRLLRYAEATGENWQEMADKDIQEMLAKSMNVEYEDVDADLKSFIFQQLKERSDCIINLFDVNSCKKLLSYRGDCVLHKMGCLELLKWSTIERLKESYSLGNIDKYTKISEELSDYMMRGTIRAKVDEACYELYGVETDSLEELKGDKTKSVLFYGSRLAQQLQALEFEAKWDMVNKLWVELLAYSAAHCGWKEHGQELRRGGELLTHVCVLMAHLGLSEQYQIQKEYCQIY